MKKVAKYSLFTIVLTLALAMIFTSCMKVEDYYTKDDISSLINELSGEIDALELEYNAKVAELEASDKANADALAELKSDYDKKISDIQGLITQLQETDADNTKRIAQLEAQVKALLERHEHTFGDWVNFSGNSQVYCEERLFYRICTECRVLEWKQGSYEDHLFSTETIDPTCVSTGYDKHTCTTCGKSYTDNETIAGHIFSTVTVDPNCTSGGYDKHTCTTCGKSYTDNETPIADHTWNKEYYLNGSFHWLNCIYCDEVDSYGEHTTDDSGYCTVCNQSTVPTEGIIYEVSADGTYASVIGFEGDATRIIIADEYLGVPVTSIYDEAFKDSSITFIFIPDSVTSIGDRAFFSCLGLTSITVDTNNQYYMSIGGNLYSKDGKNLVKYAVGKKNISFKIPNGVTTISTSACGGCSSLANIIIPNSVITIGTGAFGGCSSLTNIIIPNSVITIGTGAFEGCSSLNSVTIGCGVTFIDDFAFYNSPSITDIYYTGSKEQWNRIIIGSFNPELTNATIHYNYAPEE